MKLSDLKPLIAASAPVLGAVIGGPFGSIAAKAISSAFGTDSSDPSTLYEAVQNDPESAVKLAQIESEQQQALKALEIQAQKEANAIPLAQLQDVSNARQREVELAKTNRRDWMQDFVGVIITLTFATLLFVIAMTKQDLTDQDLLKALIVALGTCFIQIVQYYFGSSITKMLKSD